MNFFSNLATVDWTDEESVIEFAQARSAILVGSKHPFDEEKVRRLAQEDFRRSANMASMNNHGLLSGGESYLLRTADIHVPTLVIHGTEDPIIPYPHGQHLANRIPGAVLLTLEGAGHELHAGDWDVVIEAIAKLTSTSKI